MKSLICLLILWGTTSLGAVEEPLSEAEIVFCLGTSTAFTDIQGRESQADEALVVSVRDTGAKGDGESDDTAAFQAAVDRVAGSGGTVNVPAGTYMIDAETSVQLKSKMTFRMAAGTKLKAKPNDLENSAILSLRSASSVIVSGGVLEGERRAHRGKTGEWGHGMHLDNATDISITGVEAKDCWGDGFYVAGAKTSHVTFDKIKADHNRRQGMSIVAGKHITIRDSEFQNTAGTLPETGIDIEPNEGDAVTDTHILRCTFTNNAGGGIYIGPAEVDMKTTFVTETVVEQCTFVDNGRHSIDPPAYGIRLSACAGNTLKNNSIKGHTGIGMGIFKTRNAQVLQNTVTGTRASGRGPEVGSGLLFGEDKGSLCFGNTVRGNAGKGIFQYDSDVKLSDNELADNGDDQ